MEYEGGNRVWWLMSYDGGGGGGAMWARPWTVRGLRTMRAYVL